MKEFLDPRPQTLGDVPETVRLTVSEDPSVVTEAEAVLAAAQRDAGELWRSPIDELVELVESVSGLRRDRAKTVVYYAVATHGQDNLDKIPVLTLYGPAGTGKTTLLDILGLLAREAKSVDGKATKAVIRDALIGVRTALVDEADTVYERWMENRYARKAAQVQVKRERTDGWVQTILSLFGATVLARRQPFRDPAILSRCVVVRTGYRAGGVSPFLEEDFDGYADMLKSIAATVPWEDIRGRQGDRIDDTWAPLRCVAAWLKDEAWLGYATEEIDKARSELRLGQGEEPTEAVFQAILALALEDDRPIATVAERIPLSAIAKHFVEEGEKLNSWQVGQIARQLGFGVGSKGGTRYVYTGGADTLRAIGLDLGISDEWLGTAA